MKVSGSFYIIIIIIIIHLPDRKIPIFNGICSKDPKFNQIKPQDIATAHLRAATVPQASNGRFIVSQGQIGSQQISALLRHNLPALASRTPEGTPSTSSLPANAYGADSSPAEQVLGVELRSTADTFAEFGEMVGGGWGTAVSRAGGGGDYVRGWLVWDEWCWI